MGILKNKDLPKWLDKIIYTDFGAIFEPHPKTWFIILTSRMNL